MIGAPYNPEMENRIWWEIRIVKQIYEILLVHPLEKKPKNSSFEPGSITFTKADLEKVQHPRKDPLVIQLRIHNYNVKLILVDSGSSVRWCTKICSRSLN